MTFTDELSTDPQAVVTTPGCVDDLLAGIIPLLSETLVSQVGASFQFHIRSEDGQRNSYYLDLSQGDGSCDEMNEEYSGDQNSHLDQFNN